MSVEQQQTITIEEAQRMVQEAVASALESVDKLKVTNNRPRRAKRPGMGSELADTVQTGIRTVRKTASALERASESTEMMFDLAKMGLESSYYEIKLEALDNKADFYSALTQRKQELIAQGMSEEDVNRVLQ